MSKIDRNADTHMLHRRNWQRLVQFIAHLTFPNYTTAKVPTNPVKGQVYYDLTTNHFLGWNGTAWKQLDN